MSKEWTSKAGRHAAFIVAVRRGNTDDDLRAIFGISQSTVVRWKKNAPQTAGRPPSEERLRRIKTSARLARRKNVAKGKAGAIRFRPDFPTCQAVANELNENFGYDVCAETVRRDLMSVGVVSRRRPRHPNLAIAKARVAFAKLRLANDAEREALLFCDEHTISSNDSSSQTQLVKIGQRPFPRETQRIQNVASRSVFAIIGVGYKSDLAIFPKKEPTDPKKGYRLNAQRYIDLCLAPFLPDLIKKPRNRHRRVFMQDGAKSHTAKLTLNWLKRKKVLVLAGHPASSPDLNPIECLWAELNRRISLLAPHDDDSLIAAAYEAWDSFTQAEIDAFALHYKSQCEAVIANHGK